MTPIARLVDRRIDAALLAREVEHPGCGAISIFLGTVRDVNDGRAVSGIDYTAYQAMASAELQRIASEAAARFEGTRIVVEHRLGYLPLGDVSVGIATAHPRRVPSMDAARFIIEELKRRVPIWKREHYVDGTREWVDPTRSEVPTGRSS